MIVKEIEGVKIMKIKGSVQLRIPQQFNSKDLKNWKIRNYDKLLQIKEEVKNKQKRRAS